MYMWCGWIHTLMHVTCLDKAQQIKHQSDPHHRTELDKPSAGDRAGVGGGGLWGRRIPAVTSGCCVLLIIG